MAVRRGDIVTVAGGGNYAGKPRPAVVFQDDALVIGSLIIIPITSVFADAPTLRVYLTPGEETGIREPSWVMGEKITAVPVSRVGPTIGRVGKAELVEIERAVVVATGIAGR